MPKSISKHSSTMLWVVQGVLALLFLFAGGFKETMSIQALSQATGFNGWFMRFIGLAEIAGALGLVLPGIAGIKRELVPLAAAGLVVIMIGAVTTSALRLGIASAIMPAVVAILLIVVVAGRRERSARRVRSVSFDVSSRVVQAQ